MLWMAGRERTQLQGVISHRRTNFRNNVAKKTCRADICAWCVPRAVGCRDWGVHWPQTNGVPNF